MTAKSPNKLLIANRGEIACRIIRTASRMGIGTVLAVSAADRRSLAASMADAIVEIGPAPAAVSYLNRERVIAAALRSGCEAIHPGYGFLSENADFADAVIAAGLIFVGPRPESMRALGSKAAAKAVAIGCGVPVVAGYQGERQDTATLEQEAKRIGFPVLVKAVDGGGGRGMRRVDRAEDMAAALESARREAMAAFGSDGMLVEALIERPRHIEVQVFGDRQGNVVHMFERDCSLQRRNQKVMEEAPAPGLSQALRDKMTAAAVTLAKAVGYENAGTVEFLVEPRDDDSTVLDPDRPFYFIEMNTRLQVEHPVTEEITGLDLVEWQLRVAAGEPLPLGQDAITMSGHAIEVRINAEDPGTGFLPSVGTVHRFHASSLGHPRWERSVGGAGEKVTTHYDSLLAKVIVKGVSRSGALGGIRLTLAKSWLLGVSTNMAFLHALAEDLDVVAGRLDTGLIERKLGQLTATGVTAQSIAAAAAQLIRAPANVALDVAPPSREIRWRALPPWSVNDAFQLGTHRRQQFQIAVDGAVTIVEAVWGDGGQLVIHHAGASVDARLSPPGPYVHTHDGVYLAAGLSQVHVGWPTFDAEAGEEEAGGDAVRSPINGRLVRVFAAAADEVRRGDRIAIVEAMKMEHVLTAPRDGRIARIAAVEGQQVALGAIVATFEGADGGDSEGGK